MVRVHKLMAHPSYIPFRVLHRACVDRNLSVTLQIFDGGETVTIKDGSGMQIYRVTREYGHTENAPAAAMQWLIENDYISSGDVEG